MSISAPSPAANHRRPALIQASIGLLVYCTLSALSFVHPFALNLMVLTGLALPLLWEKLRGDWEALGFTRGNLGPALRWGVAGGLASGLIGFFTLAETPLPALRSSRTPFELVYVRNHYEVPELAGARWTLTIDGAIHRPQVLSFDDLTAMPSKTITVTMECAGNGRNRRPQTKSSPPLQPI